MRKPHKRNTPSPAVNDRSTSHPGRDRTVSYQAAKPEQVQQLFAEIIATPTAEQAALLDRQAKKNPALAAEVRELLACDQQGTGFLEVGVPAPRGNPASQAVPDVPGFTDLTFVAEGGQAIVYRAIQSSTRQHVAIKVMKEITSDQPEHRQRHAKEIAILTRLQHPNIVSILHCGTTADGRDFFVTRYIDGYDLDGYVKRAQLSLAQIVALCGRIARAIDAAHRSGIIHRDLKPSNIRIDRHGEPHILDFGLAKGVDGISLSTGAIQTTPGSFMGSVPWACPEQIDSDFGPITARSDVYQLGVIFYQLVSGSFPYNVRGELLKVFQNILQCAPRPLSEPTSPWQLRQLDAVILRALSKPPQDRFSTAKHLAEAMERAVQVEIGSTVVVPPPQPRRRGRWRALIAPVLVASLLIGVGFVAIRYLFDAQQRGEDPVGALVMQLFQNDAPPEERIADTVAEDDKPTELQTRASASGVGDVSEANATESPSESDAVILEEQEGQATVETSPDQTTLPDHEEPVTPTPVPPHASPVPARSQPTHPRPSKAPPPPVNLVSNYGEVDFHQIDPGKLPTNWERTGNCGVELSEGIPGLGIIGRGNDAYALANRAVQLGGKFFIEAQISGAMYSHVEFQLASQGSSPLNLRFTNERNSDWSLISETTTFDGLAARTALRPNIWLRIEHELDGVYVIIDGDPSTRKRVADAKPVQFTVLELRFPTSQHQNIYVQNLRWGPLEPDAELPTQPFGTTHPPKPGQLPKGWTQMGTDKTKRGQRFISERVQIGRQFTASFSFEFRNGPSSFSWYLIGSKSGPSLPLHFVTSSNILFISSGQSQLQLDLAKRRVYNVEITRDGDEIIVQTGGKALNLSASQLGNFDRIEVDLYYHSNGTMNLKTPVIRPNP